MDDNIFNKFQIGHPQKNNLKTIHTKKNVQTIITIQLFDYYKKMYLMTLMIGLKNYVMQLKKSKMGMKLQIYIYVIMGNIIDFNLI